MHDRRIEGKVHTFGNEGVLFMYAMTWWDRETGSVWSQPWGAAIAGELTGTSLTLLPYELVPWQTWLDRHPDTKVLVDEQFGRIYGGQTSIDNFVIGVSIGDAATGFYFASSAIAGVVNGSVGDVPVAVFADKDTRVIHAFLRSPRRGFNGPENLPDTLTFELVDSGESTGPREVRDVETGSTWDIEVGVATSGPLKGTLLQRAPYVPAFDWAWEDFNPKTVLWGDSSDVLD